MDLVSRQSTHRIFKQLKQKTVLQKVVQGLHGLCAEERHGAGAPQETELDEKDAAVGSEASAAVRPGASG